MQGSTLRNLRLFRSLCGEDCYRNIVLCTTFWDVYKEHNDITESRLEDLEQEEHWGCMIDKGSHVCRAPESQLEARNLILRTSSNKPVPLKVQREVVDEGKTMEQTTTMLNLIEIELQKQSEVHEQEMRETKRKWTQELEARERAMREEMERMRRDMEERFSVQQKSTTQETTPPTLPPRRKSEQVEHKSKVDREIEQYRLRRAQTDLNEEFEDFVRLRKQRFDEFTRNVVKTIGVLETGKRNGHVKCNMLPIKRSYSMVCNNCMMNIGRREHYGKNHSFQMLFL
jgi:hypothetical protein